MFWKRKPVPKIPDRNRIIGHYLIEHDPRGNGQRYALYDIRVLGEASASALFWCWTAADATDLCSALLLIEQGRGPAPAAGKDS